MLKVGALQRDRLSQSPEASCFLVWFGFGLVWPCGLILIRQRFATEVQGMKF